MAAHATQGLFPARVSPPALKRTRWNTSARSRNAISEAVVLSATDFGWVWLSAAAALSLRMDSGGISHGLTLAKNAGFLMLLSVLIVLFCHVQKLYELQPRTEFEEASSVLKAIGLATLVLSASLYLSGERISRLVVGITVVLSAVALVTWRQVRRRRIAKRVAAGQDCHNVLVLGWSHAAEHLHHHFMEHRLPGYVVKGFVDRRRAESKPHLEFPERRNIDAGNVLGRVADLHNIIRANFIDEVLVFLPEERELVKQLIADARQSGLNLRVVPDSYDGLAWDAPIEHLGPFPTIQIHERPIPVLGFVLKRCVDVIGSSLALLFASPVCALIAIAIRLDSPGPIFYRSARIGRKGAAFTCYKFRTMVQNAESLREKLSDLNERKGILFKIAKDPRITRVGGFLRKYSLDEIPQFWNVLRGDMSLVGPRPPVPGEYKQYELDHLKRLHVTPGITGLWQVEARTSASFESYINLDSHYVDNWSVWLDLKILLRTVGVVFAGTGQ